VNKKAALALLFLLSVSSCGGDGGGDGGGPSTGGGSSPEAPIPDNATFISANGGGAAGAAAFGGRGADLDIISGGNLFVGVTAPPLAPELPTAPAFGTPVGNWTNVQTISTGNAILSGEITALTMGTDATLNITTGDLVIDGTLLAGNNGPVETNLFINVPSGTVWIRGSIRSGRIDSATDGDSAGDVTITALRIVFTGSIDARGEDGGGSGGNVVFDTRGGATSQLLSGGSVDVSGGAQEGADPRGGAGGVFRMSSTGIVRLFGTKVASHGGAASGAGAASGGSGGAIMLEGDGGVVFHGSFAGVGGNASSSSGDATAGRGAGFFVNDLAIFDSGPVAVYGLANSSGGAAQASGVAIGGTAGRVLIRSGSDIDLGTAGLSLRGADSGGHAGRGGDANLAAAGDVYFDGTVNVSDGGGGLSTGTGVAGDIAISTFRGDMLISGELIANGGLGSNDDASAKGPSDGGTIEVRAGSGGGTITVGALMQAIGGSDSGGPAANAGGRGGTIEISCAHASGSVYLEPGSLLQVDGGTAGVGGRVELRTGGGSASSGLVGGNISLRGVIFARGDAAAGSVLANSDSEGDGRGGAIVVNSGATIDVSGGGSASHEAVTFDADGNDSNDPSENGVVVNQGTVLARGTGPGSTGGDVRFDGLEMGLIPGPEPGTIDLTGEGTSGAFISQ
jgi:hypothetical protein